MRHLELKYWMSMTADKVFLSGETIRIFSHGRLVAPSKHCGRGEAALDMR
jgi:hypothetical protein